MMETPKPALSARYIIAASIVLAIFVKALTVWHYGPSALGDNAAFIAAADEMLAGTQWLSDAGLDRSVTPPTLWRPIGYSMVIAAFKTTFGDNWSVALSAFQATLSLLAGLLLMRLCLTAKLPPVWAAAVFLLYEWSVPLSSDALIMEDAMTGALGMTAFIILLLPIARSEVPSARDFLLVGMTAALSFLIRDVYHFVMPLFGLAALIIMAKVVGLRAGLKASVAMVLPVFVLVFALQNWNEHRTGTPVTTTAGQTAYLYGVLIAAQYDPDLLAGDDIVSQTMRGQNKTFDYVDTRRINDVLFHDHGMNSVAQAQAASRLFWGSLATNPAPFVRAALHRIRPVQQGTLFSGPVTRIDDLDWWALGATAENFYQSGWRADAQAFRASLSPGDLTPEVFFHLSIRTLTRIIGVLALAVFVFGVPVLWLKKRKTLHGVAHAGLIIWGVYGLWVCMYIPVSFEVRYLSPLIGPALLATALVIVHTPWPLRKAKPSAPP